MSRAGERGGLRPTEASDLGDSNHLYATKMGASRLQVTVRTDSATATRLIELENVLCVPDICASF